MNAIAVEANKTTRGAGGWKRMLGSFMKQRRTQQILRDQRSKAYRERGTPYFERGLQFYVWANSMHDLPTFSQVMEQFSVGRATAYRWLAMYKRVRDGGWS